MATVVRSFSKVNLGLAVGPVRGDGFHGLVTVYQTVGLFDLVRVSVEAAGDTLGVDRISLRCERGGAVAVGVPQTATGDGEKNTAWRMVEGALRRMRGAGLLVGEFAGGIQVDIHIEKRLPVQGGMGAGSANAAAALIGLERELGVALPAAARLALAAEVGSDVPLFLVGGTVLGLGRGEQVFPLPDFPGMRCVIAVPAVGVSTAAAFRALDARGFGAGRRDMGGASQSTRSQVSKSRPGAARAAAGLDVGGDIFFESARETSRKAELTAQAEREAEVLTFQQGEGRLEELSRVLCGAFTLAYSQAAKQAGPSGIVRNAPSDNGLRKPSAEESHGTTANLAENALLALVRTGVENDFEEVAFSEHPSLRDIKRALTGDSAGPAGAALYASLSGSGSALFGLYGSDEAAVAAQQRVQALGVEAILTETLPRAEYWKRMFAE